MFSVFGEKVSGAQLDTGHIFSIRDWSKSTGVGGGGGPEHFEMWWLWWLENT